MTDIKEMLIKYISQIETLESEKSDIQKQISNIYIAAELDGVDKKALKALISLRKKDKEELQEFECILDSYRAVLEVMFIDS